MKVKVIRNHDGEGIFPTFSKGTSVKLTGAMSTDYDWYPCEIDGYASYISGCFIENGQLTRDYNPTELIQESGDLLEVIELISVWLVAVNKQGKVGWFPAEKCMSVG